MGLCRTNQSPVLVLLSQLSSTFLFVLMMAAAASFVSQEEFNLFHSIDRDLYKVLVINLGREPAASMQIMALYLWLERIGYRHVVKRILSLPLFLVNDVSDEAMACLGVIVNPILASVTYSEGNDIPLLQSLVDKPISLQFFYQNHVTAAGGVALMMQDVCVRAMTDIMQFALTANTAGGSRTQLVFGSIAPSYLQNELLVGNGVPADDRTMFLTFSKGYPVDEVEVRTFLTLVCGRADCVESLYMQEVQPYEQSLYARVTFFQASTMDMILRGEDKVKFSINGKHVWARKFVPKRRVLLPPPPPPPAHFQNPYPGESSGSTRT